MAAAQEIGRLIVRLVGDGKQYQAMLVRGATQTKAFAAQVSASMRAAGASIASLGRSMALRLTAPLLIIGALATNSFAKFDKAMIESMAIMDVTTQQMEEMRQVALSLSISGQGAQGATDLARSYFFLASAGKDAAQSIALLPKVMDFATAGAFDMALATDLLTDAQSALGLTSKNVIEDTENMVRVSDVLVKANTLANASVQQFSTALTSKAGAAMKSFNIPLEEGVAVLAAFADQGIKAELAGNSFSRMLLLMSKAARDNTADWERLNFEMFDANGNVRNMADIVANLEDALSGLSPEMKTAELAALGFNARVQGAILPLLGTSESIRRYIKEMDEAGGITKEVSERQMKSFSGQMKNLKNRIEEVAIELGEQLVPIINQVSESIATAVSWWKSLSTETKAVITQIALFAAAVGPLLIVLGSLIKLTAFIGGAFLSLPISGTTAAVVALTAVVVVLAAKLGLLKPVMTQTGNFMGWMEERFRSLQEFVHDEFLPTLEGLGLFDLPDLSAPDLLGSDQSGNVTTVDPAQLLGFSADEANRMSKEINGIEEAIQPLVLSYRRLSEEARKAKEEAQETGSLLLGWSVPLTDILNKAKAVLDAEKEANAQRAMAAKKQKELNEEALITVQNLRDEFRFRNMNANQIAAKKLEERGADKFLTGQIRSLDSLIEKEHERARLSEEQIALTKRQAEEAQQLSERVARAHTREMEQQAKDQERRVERARLAARTPEQFLNEERKRIGDLVALGLDEASANRLTKDLEERFVRLKEQAIIPIRILGPRAASQLGTLEADRRLAEFRTALSQPKRPGIPGPNLPPGAPRFSAPQFRHGISADLRRGAGSLAPEDPQLQRVQTNQILDDIAKLLLLANTQRDELLEKDPVEFEEVSAS